MKHDGLRAQERLIAMHFDKFETAIKDNVLIARGSVQPCNLCEEYLIVVAYAEGVRPVVRVLDPAPVKVAHGQRNPHLNGDGTICLYDPDANEWNDGHPIALTIIPWTCEWLLFYEWWLASGTWHGGGVTLEELLAQYAANESN